MRATDARRTGSWTNLLDGPTSEISHQSGQPGDEHQGANRHPANPEHSAMSVDRPKPKHAAGMPLTRLGAELAIVRQACNFSKQEERTEEDAD